MPTTTTKPTGIPKLDALIEQTKHIPPRPKPLLESVAPGTKPQAGQVWMPKGSEENLPTLLVVKVDEETSLIQALPSFSEIEYSGVEDAIFPSRVFGYEAAVATGCIFTTTEDDLLECEGQLPEEWFEKLEGFAERLNEGTTSIKLDGIMTGRPFTHTEDPGFLFHEKLVDRTQPLMAKAMKTIWG